MAPFTGSTAERSKPARFRVPPSNVKWPRVRITARVERLVTTWDNLDGTPTADHHEIVLVHRRQCEMQQGASHIASARTSGSPSGLSRRSQTSTQHRRASRPSRSINSPISFASADLWTAPV
jgi:hypothetical protein